MARGREEPHHRPVPAGSLRRADPQSERHQEHRRDRRVNESGAIETDPERIRLDEDARREKNWKRWGPYLSERQWGTVREDYSATGECWEYFPHDHARSRAYRWGEDGLLGICDREGPAVLCARACGTARIRSSRSASSASPEQPGQSRRGRQRVLLLRRLFADALLHEGGVQISAAGVSLSATDRRESQAQQSMTRNSNFSIRASSTTAAISTSRWSMRKPRPTIF